MKELLDKIKGLDRKILISGGLIISIILIVIIVMVIANGNKTTDKNDSQVDTEWTDSTDTEEGIGTENETELGTENTTEFETEMGTELESEDTESESQMPGVGGTTVTQPEDVDGVEQSPVTTTPEGEELLGDGTAENPYVIIPDGETMTFTTVVAVPAGGSLYYSVMKTAGKWFSIDDPNAYVEYEGVKYEAKNGVLSFKVNGDKALNTDYLVFKIGNNGSTEQKFTIELTDEKGTRNNPETIGDGGSYSLSLVEGNSTGYFYKCVAKKTGTLRFYFSDASQDCAMNVTNNSGGSVQKSFETKIENDVSKQPEDYNVDAQGRRYVEISVKAGDQILISVSACPARGKYPAVTCTWVMEWR